MKVLVTYSWLGTREYPRFERMEKWLNFHRAIKAELGIDQIILLDNASDIKELSRLGEVHDADVLWYAHTTGVPLPKLPEVAIYRFSEYLDRPSMYVYPSVWRNFDYLRKLIQMHGLTKMIYVDSDFYILTSRLAHYMRAKNTEWTAWYCHKYGFADPSMWVLCPDAFPRLEAFPIPDFHHYDGKQMEDLIEFTDVLKTGWIGDRYGETYLPQTPEMDFYGQWQPGCPTLRFDMK